jgi:hypothetical protein
VRGLSLSFLRFWSKKSKRESFLRFWSKKFSAECSDPYVRSIRTYTRSFRVPLSQRLVSGTFRTCPGHSGLDTEFHI